MIARVSTSLVGAALALLVAPALAPAQDPTPTPTPTPSSSPGGVAAPVMAPMVEAETASSGRVTISAMPDQTLGQVGRFSGTAPAGRVVRLQRLDPKTQRWSAVASLRADATGGFVAHWRPDHIGETALRAVSGGSAAPLNVLVYKPALATWYGPGFFGNLTACGIALTPDLVGVAHRWLPCGTQVSIAYGGRVITAPVIDRGPFGVAGAELDLTQAAALTLGITTTSHIGAVRLR
jgi:rare lipoprotein A